MSTEPESVALMDETPESHVLRVVGWFSVGMVLATLGFFVGRELRDRYKFKQRTPYDFYSNAGEAQTADYGMGV